jgi:hypothetical protein
MAPSERFVKLSTKVPTGMPVASANFLVLVDNQHKALDLRFEDGTESLRSLESTLRSATYPLNVPDDLPARLAVQVKVGCDAENVCVGMVDYPSRVELKK